MFMERDRNQKAEIADLKDEFQRKLGITEREHKVLRSTIAELQEREQQALLDKLRRTERHYQMRLKRREEELRDMEESLRLMREKAARQRSADRRKAYQELIEHETMVADVKLDAQKGQTAFKGLRVTTKNSQRGIISGISGSVATAVLTGGMFV